MHFGHNLPLDIFLQHFMSQPAIGKDSIAISTGQNHQLI